jgi:hypothetical protein
MNYTSSFSFTSSFVVGILLVLYLISRDGSKDHPHHVDILKRTLQITEDTLKRRSMPCPWNFTTDFDGSMTSYYDLFFSHIGSVQYVLNDPADEVMLTNGSLTSTFDDPVLWMYRDYVTESAYRRSILNIGEGGQYARLKAKLASKEDPVTIVTLGGSISCAVTYGKWHPDSPRGDLKNAWPAFLEIFLKRQGNSPHINIHNLCLSGSGTNVFVDRILEWREDRTHVIHRADLVIVETVANDVEDLSKNMLENRYGYGVNVQHFNKTSEEAAGSAGGSSQHEKSESERDSIAQETEMLARLLLLLPNRPALLWVGTSSRTSSVCSALSSHLKVTVPYGIPHLDMLHSMGSLDTKMQIEWYTHIYRSDGVHITKFGHRMVAFYVFLFINELICQLDCGLRNGETSGNGTLQYVLPIGRADNDAIIGNQSDKSYGQALIGSSSSPSNFSCTSAIETEPEGPPSEIDVVLQSPLYIDDTRARMYERSRPYHLDFQKPQLTEAIKTHLYYSSGFDHFADKGTKFGFIGANASNYFVLRFLPLEVRTHFRFGQIDVEYLSSYENVGRMKIEVISTMADVSVQPPQCVQNYSSSELLLVSREIDAQWNEKVSITTSEHLSLDLGQQVEDRNHYCIFMNFSVLPSVPSRAINKIKIIYVVII